MLQIYSVVMDNKIDITFSTCTIAVSAITLMNEHLNSLHQMYKRWTVYL